MQNFDNQNKTRKKLYTPVPTNEVGKLQPQAIELEEAVLGAVLLESDAFFVVSTILKEEHFYKEQNGLIFKAVMQLAAKNERIDILTVSQQLKRNGDLEVVGGSYYVSALTNRIASSANIEYHARIVAQKFISRQMILLSTQVIMRAYEEGTDCFDLIDFSNSETTKLLNGFESKQAMQIGIIKEQVIANCKQALFNEKPTGVPIKLTPLQKNTNGWRKSNLIILAARPGMGKTAVALDFAYQPAKLHNIPVALFSLEMSKLELCGRIMSAESGITSQKINNNTTNPDELNAVINDSKVLDGVPLYIDDTAALSLVRLRSKAYRLVMEQGVQLIVIDYLQLMSGSGDEGNREQEISVISRGLKALAKELDIPIIALSQLSRQVENRPGHGKKPQLSDLRESGAIEQDADMVIFLYRPAYYGIDYYDHYGEEFHDTSQLMILVIAKFRGGALGDIKARWIGETTSIHDWDREITPCEVVESNINSGLQNNTDFLSKNDIEETFK